MKFRGYVWVSLFFGLFLTGLLAAQTADSVCVQGEPPIMMNTIKNHIKLFEFILQTRLTTKQKTAFRETVAKEGLGMDKEAREEFIQADPLVASLPAMTPEQKTAVRDILRADYEESADNASEDDPAAAFFNTIVKDTQKKVAETPTCAFTMQALNAFVEYLEFSRGLPEAPKPLSEAEREALTKSLTNGFKDLPDSLKNALNNFERTWHVIKTAWTGDSSKRPEDWKKQLQAPFAASPTVNLFDEKWLPKAIQPTLWDQMATAAALLGETETDWAATSAVEIW